VCGKTIYRSTRCGEGWIELELLAEEDLVAVGDRARFQGFKEAKRLALQSRRINRDPESLKLALL